MVKRALASLLLLACNVESKAGDTGGATLGDGGSCPRGIALVSSDRSSSNLGLLDLQGKVLSASVLSSGSRPVGISQVLSGDVVLPQAAPASGAVVLIDRFPNAVLTFIEAKTGVIQGQLSVATGFPSNPHDYVEVSPSKAYVTRYGDNASAGKEPFDSGSDILVVDPVARKITGSVPLPKLGALLPRPDRMLAMPKHAQVWLTLQRFNVNFREVGDSELAGVSTQTDTLAWTTPLTGARNCGAMALSPSGQRAVIACSGPLIDNRTNVAGSMLVVLDTQTSPPVVQKQILPAGALDSVFAQGVAFASESVVIGTTYGDKVSGKTDRIYMANIDTDEQRVLLDTKAAFVLGDDVRCLGACADRCFVPDASLGVLHVVRANGDLERTVTGGATFGLAPRALGLL